MYNSVKMEDFREFEIEAIRILTEGILSGSQFQAIRDAEISNKCWTGSGYFLTVKHPSLPESGKTLHEPAVIGTFGDVIAGFVVFLGDGELTLECHPWGPVDVPENFRDQIVAISWGGDMWPRKLT